MARRTIRRWILGFGDSTEAEEKRLGDYFQAATNGDLVTFSRFVSQGIHINTVNPKQGDLSAIHLAVATNAMAVINFLLLRKELDISDCSKINNQGLTIFHTAVNSNRLELAKRFYELFPYQAYIPDRAGRTVLHTAVANPTGSMEMINYLLSLEVNADLSDKKYWTALMYAIQKSSDEMFFRLLDHGVNVNEPCEMNSCVSPLKVAIAENKLDQVITLLDRGARTQFDVRLTTRTYREDDDPIWKTTKMKTENLATFAIKNIDLSLKDPIPGIKIAYEVVKASADPPAVEAIFELYGRYILKSTKGQRRSRWEEIELSRENNTISDKITDHLLQVIAMSLACCHGPILHMRKLKERFQFDDDSLCQLVQLHENKEPLEQHMTALSIRRQLVLAGFGNVKEALLSEDYSGTPTALATMEWCIERDVLWLDKRDRPSYQLM